MNNNIRLSFADAIEMDIGGFNCEPDWPKIGPSLVIANSLILAIRTARWPCNASDQTSDMEWEAEIEHSIKIASRVLSLLISKKSSMFPSRDVPWYQPSDEDVMK